MSQSPSEPSFPDVFTLAELSMASGASVEQLEAWAEVGAIRTLPVGDGLTWVSSEEAVRVGAALRLGSFSAMAAAQRHHADQPLFARQNVERRAMRGPLAVSSSVHAGLIAATVLATTLGVGQASTAPTETVAPRTLRLVYLALPGPGGGGGGGGARQAARPPRAERHGRREITSPVPARERPKLPEPVEIPRAPEPPLVEPEPLPPVQAPVVASPSDNRDVAGVIDEPTPVGEISRGPGDGGGAGTGAGPGPGEGEGAGIGEGSGGGTGGGAYRPGGGISPPALLREVRPDYTEEARRQGVQGDVLLEIVVRSDGSVGEVRVLQGLGHGLDQRAVAAVRQWRFSPARLHATPVDVLVEVSMEFTLR